jgi:hypothetical protein
MKRNWKNDIRLEELHFKNVPGFTEEGKFVKKAGSG